jgi:hypothetical protein
MGVCAFGGWVTSHATCCRLPLLLCAIYCTFSQFASFALRLPEKRGVKDAWLRAA